jgi:hypothetical protein
MDKEAIRYCTLAVLALAVVLALGLLAVSLGALPKAASAQEPPPPQPVDNTFTVEGACDFPVLIEESGKVMDIPLPGGDILRIFPGARSTLTNLEEPSNQITLRGGGKGRVTPPSTEGGDLLVTVTGHNVLVVPGEGIFEVRQATFTLAPPYDVGSELTVLERQGEIVDLCARLS